MPFPSPHQGHEIVYRGQRYPIRQAIFVVGSHPSCDLKLPGDAVDPAHMAILQGASGGCWIVPLSARERAVVLGENQSSAAWVGQDAAIEVAGETLELLVRGDPAEPPEAGLAPPEGAGEMSRLWGIWREDAEPGPTRFEDPRGWAFRDARRAYDALMDLVERPEGDQAASLVASLRAGIGPARVELYEVQSQPGASPIEVTVLEPGDPPKFTDHRLRRLMSLSYQGEAPCFSDDLYLDPRTSLAEPARRNLIAAMVAPLGERRLVVAWRRIQEGAFAPHEKLAFTALVALAAVRQGIYPYPWHPPLLPGFGPELCVSHGRRRALERELTVLGRDPGGADLLLGEDDCSRRHAALLRAPDGKVFLVDLGSKMGTFLNDDLVLAERVFDGDEVRFGSSTRFRFRYDRIGVGFAEAAVDLLRRVLEWYAQGRPGKVPGPGI